MIPIAVAIAALLVPVAIGAIASRLRAFDDPGSAIDVMNRVALHVAFPALVIASLADPATSIDHGPVFLALVPLALAIALVITRVAIRSEHAGTVALVIAFGNTAYLGLPFVGAVLGRDALATAAVAVAIHVALAMTVGPALLLRWGGGRGDAARIARLARSPLVWSPLIGIALRALPPGPLSIVRSILEPLGGMAAPLSMILLGVYLHVHRRRLAADRAVAIHAGARLLLAPAVTIGLVVLARALRTITLEEARVLVILSAMPAAITTFAIALEHRIGAERIAAAIVASTLASALTLPIACWIALSIA